MKRVTKIVETAQIFCFIVSTMVRMWFGLVALFADHLFLHLFFVSAFVASSRCIVTTGRGLFFFNRTVAVSPF